MKKKCFLFLITLSPFLRLTAQVSETEQIFRSANNSYVQCTSIVRNYSSMHNVIMQYGYYTNTYFQDSCKCHSSFLIQNTSTGSVTHIIDLPRGYKVNDVRFVTLRGIDGASTVDFCCFCGTRTQFEYYASFPSQPSQYYPVYSTHGFVGFFAMNEALSPTTSYTAKVRDVEKTKELYRMTCYAEEYGYYYGYQNSFIDNAVLDIIGTDDMVNAPSCFCRAKFYPDCYGSTRWDNNIRYNTNEILTDITKTDNNVVTSSYCTTGNTLWIRYSGLEDHLIIGGLQLNSNINSIDFTSLTIRPTCSNSIYVNYFNRIGPAKICHTQNNGIEISYCAGQEYAGLLNSQYDYSNGTLNFIKGAYWKFSPSLKEIIYMPSNQATAVLYTDSSDNNIDKVSVLTWNQIQNCGYSVKAFYNNNINAHSITLQNRNGYEHLLWSGKMVNNQTSPMYMMSQRGPLGNGYTQTCHNNEEVPDVDSISINHNIISNSMPIMLRFAYDAVTYPVTYINYNIYNITTAFPCRIY